MRLAADTRIMAIGDHLHRQGQHDGTERPRAASAEVIRIGVETGSYTPHVEDFERPSEGVMGRRKLHVVASSASGAFALRFRVPLGYARFAGADGAF